MSGGPGRVSKMGLSCGAQGLQPQPLGDQAVHRAGKSGVMWDFTEVPLPAPAFQSHRFFFFFQFVCLLHREAWGILVPHSRIESRPLAVKVRSPNYWTARGVPHGGVLMATCGGNFAQGSKVKPEGLTTALHPDLSISGRVRVNSLTAGTQAPRLPHSPALCCPSTGNPFPQSCRSSRSMCFHAQNLWGGGHEG